MSVLPRVCIHWQSHQKARCWDMPNRQSEGIGFPGHRFLRSFRNTLKTSDTGVWFGTQGISSVPIRNGSSYNRNRDLHRRPISCFFVFLLWLFLRRTFVHVLCLFSDPAKVFFPTWQRPGNGFLFQTRQRFCSTRQRFSRRKKPFRDRWFWACWNAKNTHTHTPTH